MTDSDFQSILAQFADKTQLPVNNARIVGSRGTTLNHTMKIEIDNCGYFIKTHGDSEAVDWFKGEAASLKAIKNTGVIHAPEVMLTGSSPYAFLLMEWIEPSQPLDSFWTIFGEQVAAMHQITQTEFGFSEPTFCGNVKQSNRNHANWQDFYFYERLEPEVRYAVDTGKFSKLDLQLFNQFADWYFFETRLPEEPPSLIHGDLWSGNFICDQQEQPVLIDPSVYFGHREIDIGMSLLFGGFQSAFYQSYEKVWPLEKGYNFRKPLTQLYHLLIHVHLFGGHYIDQTLAIFRGYLR